VNDLRKQMKVAGALNPLDEVCRKACRGEFEAYEVLVLALSPSLRAINLANFPKTRKEEYSTLRSRWTCDWIDIPAYRPLSLLCDAICSLHELQKPIWPPGFRSMRKIYINSRGLPSIGMYWFTPILMLPNIESIHVGGLRSDFVVPLIFETLLPPASSSVQHLSLV
jgi:hypothetical protein